jgi:hypothetical protein
MKVKKSHGDFFSRSGKMEKKNEEYEDCKPPYLRRKKWRCLNFRDGKMIEEIKQEPKKKGIKMDITACSPFKVKIRFGGTYRHHFQGPIRRERHQSELIKMKVTVFWDITIMYQITRVLIPEICNFHSNVENPEHRVIEETWSRVDEE